MSRLDARRSYVIEGQKQKGGETKQRRSHFT